MVTNPVSMAQAGPTPPANPITGMIYFNTGTNALMMYNGLGWVHVTSASEPYNLFIDDVRNTMDVDLSPMWLGMDVRTAHTYEMAIEIIEKLGLPERISFDHDLGEGQPPATHIMWHIINGHLDGKWDCTYMKEVQVHSANPVGARNLLLLWRGFCQEHDIVMDIVSKPCLK
jgi:hypothetical protein